MTEISEVIEISETEASGEGSTSQSEGEDHVETNYEATTPAAVTTVSTDVPRPLSYQTRKSSQICPKPAFPEWWDAFINYEIWNENEFVNLEHFEDPAGEIELDLADSSMTTEWIQPGLLFLDEPMLVDFDSPIIDFTNPNVHVSELPDLVRLILCEISDLYDFGVDTEFQLEGEGTAFVTNSEPDGISWKPWDHIYSRCKAGVKGSKPKFNPVGKYYVRLYFMDAWRRITVDDRIPILENGHVGLPLTSKNELWPMILTKALLKIASISWDPQSKVEVKQFSTIAALTGWMHVWIDIREPISGPTLWEELQDMLPNYTKRPTQKSWSWKSDRNENEDWDDFSRGSTSLSEKDDNNDRTSLTMTEKEDNEYEDDYDTDHGHSTTDAENPTSQESHSRKNKSIRERWKEAMISTVKVKDKVYDDEDSDMEKEHAKKKDDNNSDKGKGSPSKKEEDNNVETSKEKSKKRKKSQMKADKKRAASGVDMLLSLHDNDEKDEIREGRDSIAPAKENGLNDKALNKSHEKEKGEISRKGGKKEKKGVEINDVVESTALTNHKSNKKIVQPSGTEKGKNKDEKDKVDHDHPKKGKKDIMKSKNGTKDQTGSVQIIEETVDETDEDVTESFSWNDRKRSTKGEPAYDIYGIDNSEEHEGQTSLDGDEHEQPKAREVKITTMAGVLQSISKRSGIEYQNLASTWEPIYGKDIPVILKMFPRPIVPSFLFHPMHLVQLRDAQLYKYPNKSSISTPLWKSFRWKAWAMDKGKISLEDVEKVKSPCKKVRPPFVLKNDWYFIGLGGSEFPGEFGGEDSGEQGAFQRERQNCTFTPPPTATSGDYVCGGPYSTPVTPPATLQTVQETDETQEQERKSAGAALSTMNVCERYKRATLLAKERHNSMKNDAANRVCKDFGDLEYEWNGEDGEEMECVPPVWENEDDVLDLGHIPSECSASWFQCDNTGSEECVKNTEMTVDLLDEEVDIDDPILCEENYDVRCAILEKFKDLQETQQDKLVDDLLITANEDGDVNEAAKQAVRDKYYPQSSLSTKILKNKKGSDELDQQLEDTKQIVYETDESMASSSSSSDASDPNLEKENEDDYSNLLQIVLNPSLQKFREELGEYSSEEEDLENRTKISSMESELNLEAINFTSPDGPSTPVFEVNSGEADE